MAHIKRKKTALSPDNFTLILFYSLLVVEAHIHNYPWASHQLQEGAIGEVDGIMKDSWGEISTMNTTPTSDEQATPEIPNHLKMIENTLMEDGDVDALGNFENYSDSDSAAFWLQSLQGLNNMAASKDIEYHISPNSKRKNIRMKSPHHFQVLDSRPRSSHQDPTSGKTSKDNQLHYSTPDCDSTILEMSCYNRRPRKNRKMVNVQCAPYVPGTNQLSRSEFLHSNSKNDRLKQDKLSHSKFSGRSVIMLLKLKGTIALWQNPRVSNQIDDFFHQFQKKFYLTFLSPSTTTYSKEQVDLAIKRLSTEVVMAYFGALSIFIQGTSRDISTNELIENGWEFLQTYLEQGIQIGKGDICEAVSWSKRVDAHFFSHPSIVLLYILKIGNNTSVHPSLIEALIYNWATKTIFELGPWNPKSFEHSFLSAIESEAKIRGRKIWRYSSDKPEENISEILTLVGKMKLQGSGINLNKLINNVQRNQSSYLRTIGEYILTNCKDFSKDVESFFQTLETEMKKNLERAQAVTGGKTHLIECQNIIKIKPSMIHKSINVVKLSIVPAFMGALILFHESQESDQVIKSLISTGLSTLKAYFSAWRDIFIKDKSSLILNKTGKLVKWYNAKDSLHYFCLLKSRSHDPTENVWFLSEIWYETMIQKQLMWGEELNFEPKAPHRKVTPKIFSFFETRGLLIR
ncbi:hypothetical protein DFH28DRAFT_956458 [Melampsora americana]|nr:hypothetical protein DFH28DRAFT_956458 [Melampsora americana]